MLFVKSIILKTKSMPTILDNFIKNIPRYLSGDDCKNCQPRRLYRKNRRNRSFSLTLVHSNTGDSVKRERPAIR